MYGHFKPIERITLTIPWKSENTDCCCGWTGVSQPQFPIVKALGGWESTVILVILTNCHRILLTPTVFKCLTELSIHHHPYPSYLSILTLLLYKLGGITNVYSSVWVIALQCKLNVNCLHCGLVYSRKNTLVVRPNLYNSLRVYLAVNVCVCKHVCV